MGLDQLLFGESPDGVDDGDLAVHAGGVDASRGDLKRRADDVAAALGPAGLTEGCAVGVMLPNSIDLVASLFGVWRAGGAYVPLNPRLSDTEIQRVLDTVKPAVVITTAVDAPRIADRSVVVLGDGSPMVERRSIETSPLDDGVALVQFTSGTTGAPKAVQLTHDGVLELLDGVLASIAQGRDTARKPMPNLVPVSLSLWAGIYQVLFAARLGAGVVVMDQFRPEEFRDLVARFAIRSTVLPPAAMTALSDATAVESLAPLKYIRSITAPLSPLQARRFRDRFGISVLNCYGQTEIGGEIVGWTAEDSRTFGDTKLGAAGRPHRGVTIRTVGPDLVALPDGEPGELVVHTPALAAGYADGSDLSDRMTPDGWFRTGDIGRVDEAGFVWIEGRVSDMINRGGLKVHPGEVEEVLRLDPAVSDVAVVGAPDDRLGEVPWAFVVLTVDADEAPDRWNELCREHLAPYKVPTRYVIVPVLARNEVGKVLRRELLAQA